MNNHFKVIDPNGISFGGKRYEKGETVELPAKSAALNAFVHFRQVEAVKEKAKAEDPEADAEAKAKAEAEAKPHKK